MYIYLILAFMFTNLLTNTLLCLSLARLIIKRKVGLKLDLFTKQTNINKFFFFLFQTIHKQFGSFTILNIITIITYYLKNCEKKNCPKRI